MWSEAGAQPELENSLEMGGFGYPAMAVLNGKKMKYSILRGSFSSDGINEFLRYMFFTMVIIITEFNNKLITIKFLSRTN